MPSPKAEPPAAPHSAPAATESTPVPHTDRRPAPAVRTTGQPPTWVAPTIVVLVAMLVALIGTAVMIATPEEREAVWRYKGVLASPDFWWDIGASAMEGMRLHLAGDDDGGATSGELSKLPDPTIAAAVADGDATSGGPPSITTAPPPPRPTATTKGGGASPAGERGREGLTCFTLEAYSDRFIATEKQKRHGKHFFRCGTRLTDIRSSSESDPAVLAACGDSTSTSSTLRVVLTPKEVDWHAKQRMNLAVEVFPLSRLNDNYCDCIDGTDEVRTGACSMSGAGMPFGAARWREYVQANSIVSLYEKAGVLPRASMLGGPVLPFICEGDPETWLSPTMVGDGVVDCCDGSDEAASAWGAVRGGASAGAGTGGEAPFLASVEAARLAGLSAWRQRVWGAPRASADPASASEPTAAAAPSYADRIHPHYTTAEALLTDKGFTSLLACGSVHAHRLASAEILLGVTRRGHEQFLQREVDGWEKLGRAILANQTMVAQRLAEVTGELEALAYSINDQMTVRRASNPLDAGVSEEELQRYQFLSHTRESVQQEASYLSLVNTQKVFGDHYEYYPLFGSQLGIAARSSVRTYRPAASPRARREERQRRVAAPELLQMQSQAAQYRMYVQSVRSQGAAPPSTPPPPPIPHVDNVSEARLVIIPARVAIVVQRVRGDREWEAVARAKGLLRPEDAYNRAALQAKFDDLVLSPAFTLGHWQPFFVDRNASAMAVLDPAGDVDLPRRFSIRPATQLTRGGGWTHTAPRGYDEDRALSITRDKKSKNTPQTRRGDDGAPPAAAEEEEEVTIPILYHRNTPNTLATHNFVGGDLSCGLQPASQSGGDGEGHDGGGDEGGRAPPTTSLRVAYGCADTDAVLAWARNGKCLHEVVIGTPSACTRWVLQEAEGRVARYQRNVEQTARA